MDNPNIDLYKPLKAGYSSRKVQKNSLKNDGYVFDGRLSNDNQQVYYRSTDKKLLINITGTHNLSDVGTDVYLGLGKLKDTNRFKEAGSINERAKKKYGVNSNITGHSLGGSIAQYIAGKDDQVYSLDKGATFGTTTRSNEKSYRTSGDLVSGLASGNTRVKTLSNPNNQTGIRPLDAYLSHDISNIKNAGIFV